jgi:uncharacterized membrane protein
MQESPVADRRAFPWLRLSLPLLCLYAFGFSSYYAVSNPPFEAPDEADHLKYVTFVASQGRLPIQRAEYPEVRGEGHQHPLYYVIAAAVPKLLTEDGRIDANKEENPASVLAGGKGEAVPKLLSTEFYSSSEQTAFYVLRLLNALFAALTVLVTGLAARLILPKQLQLWPPLFVATLPQFQFICGSVSNDAFAALLGAVVVYQAVRALREPGLQRWVVLGLCVGAAVLVKKSNFIYLPLCFVLPLFLPGKRPALKFAGGVAVGAAVLIGPLVYRNFSLYGDLMASGMETHTLKPLVQPKSLFSTYFLRGFPLSVLRSFHAQFGWMNVQIPVVFPVFFYGILLMPMAYVRRSARELKAQLPAIFCAAACVLSVLALVYYNLSFEQPQGRLLFPALPALALLWGIAISAADRWHRFIIVFLVATDLVAAYTNWAFYR